MDYLIYVIGGILTITGILGCIMPGIPGPPLNYIALLLLHFTPLKAFTARFLWILAFITAFIFILDYVIPVVGTKKFGAGKWGITGSIVGLITGFFIFPPIGIIIGPFVGAVAGELIAGKSHKEAFRAGFGAFLGFVFTTVMKLTVSGIMTYFYIRAFF